LSQNLELIRRSKRKNILTQNKRRRKKKNMRSRKIKKKNSTSFSSNMAIFNKNTPTFSIHNSSEEAKGRTKRVRRRVIGRRRRRRRHPSSLSTAQL
jgi:hypothetical protein